MTDEEIILLYWAHNESAISETASKYGTKCFHLAHGILNQREDAEECVNDTWLHTWNAIPPQRPSFFQAFLLKITRNLSLDRYKRSRTNKRGGAQMLLALEELSECVAGTGVPDEQVIAQDLEDCIQRFLTSLSDKDQYIFLHRYFLMENASEIGAFYQMKPSTVRANLACTRNKLSEYLHKEGYF